jgi:hypothetical protein
MIRAIAVPLLCASVLASGAEAKPPQPRASKLADRFDLVCQSEDYITGEPEKPRMYHVDLGKGVVFDGDEQESSTLVATPAKLSWTRSSEPVAGTKFVEQVYIDRVTGTGSTHLEMRQGSAEPSNENSRIRCTKAEYSGPGGTRKF